jgi:formiminotetrahydrofolate cyclodeaminase
MVARLSTGKNKFAEIEGRMETVVAEAESLRSELSHAVPRDAAAFEAVMSALQMPKGNKAEKQARAAAIEEAMHQAAAVPLEVAGLAADVLELAVEVADVGNLNAITDAASGGQMALAALRSAALNVRINAQSASDQAAAATWLKKIRALEDQANQAEQALKATLKQRADLSSD